MEDILIAYSNKKTVSEITGDIKIQLNKLDNHIIIYFASSNIDQYKLAENFYKTFPKAKIFGCSTAGEIISGKMLKNSVVVMAVSKNIITDCSIEVIEDIKDKSRDEIEKKIKASFEKFENHFGLSLKNMDFREYVGLILIDGLSRSEEKIMDIIGDLTNVIFVGASAGDDLKFKETFIYKNGKIYKNGAIVALLKPKADFDIIKTQSFSSTGKKLVATKVDEQSRTVIEFNNKPAALAYSEALGVSIDKAQNYFMTNPVGLMIKEEPYVRSPQQIKDGSMVFYCNVVENMELELLESKDILKDTHQAVFNKVKKRETVSGIINFHCILRTLELEQKNLTEDYGNIFTNIPSIGFSTYGEEYLGHINQTSTMLIL